MALEFRLPDIGEGLIEATVVRWLIPLGGPVGIDEPMVEIETDKAVVEIPAPRAGIILHQGVSEGITIAVDELLVVIGDPDEEWVSGQEPLGSVPGARSTATADAAPIVGTLEQAENIDRAHAPLRPQALPLVRRLAATLGVDLGSVTASGLGGRITRQDVEGAAQAVGPVERVRMSPTRLAIARNLTRSWQEIPHVTTYAEAAAEPLLVARKRLAEESGRQVPLEALFMRLVVPLLRKYPEFNAAVDGDEVVYRKAYDIGFAVDTPSGLLVAVVRDLEELTVESIAAEIVRLADAARERKITAAEMRGATFTVSNIGAVGGGFGTPIIPYGTSAILSIGRADLRPVVRDGQLGVGREFPLSLSYDHRIIDGAAGRAFMASLIGSIEDVV
ncbi:MAG: dihydrolipoamide acetyltransferase family protein [Acidimicrobiia bacterium]